AAQSSTSGLPPAFSAESFADSPMLVKKTSSMKSVIFDPNCSSTSHPLRTIQTKRAPKTPAITGVGTLALEIAGILFTSRVATCSSASPMTMVWRSFSANVRIDRLPPASALRRGILAGRRLDLLPGRLLVRLPVAARDRADGAADVVVDVVVQVR